MTEVSRTFAAKNEEKINTMLHEETIHNRTEPWNKLDKTTKINCVVTGIPALKINPSLRQFQLDRLTPQVSMLTSLGKGRGSILQEK